MTNIEGVSGIAAEALQNYVSRIEKLREEIKAIQQDVAQVYQEARSTGFDVKILKLLIKERTKGAQEIEEEGELLDLYRAAVNGPTPSRAGASE